MLRLTPFTLALFMAAAMPALHAQTAPDNTKTNHRDRDQNAVTADQQKQDKSDLKTAKDIRRAIVSDKSLSTYAHNVKVIVRNGTVTLKGPVHSEEERNAVVAKATAVAGAGNVQDQLSVKGGNNNADRSKNP